MPCVGSSRAHNHYAWLERLSRDKLLITNTRKLRKKKVFITLGLGQLPNDPAERKAFLRKKIWQKRRSEVLPYNECFYNAIYNYKFVLPVDIDELIFPLKFDTWNQLMDHVFEMDKTAEHKIGSFSVRNAQFFKRSNFSIDSGAFNGKLITVDSVERTANLSKPGERVKSFVNTQVSQHSMQLKSQSINYPIFIAA